jgi:hypothetical protein
MLIESKGVIMKRTYFIVFFVCVISSLLQAQQITILESKAGQSPDWLISYIMDGTPGVTKIDRFKNKCVFVAECHYENLGIARFIATRDVISSIGGFIRSIVISDSEGNAFQFNDEISAYEVITDSHSRKIEDDYWQKIKNQDGSIVYQYFKIIALEKTVVEQKLKQFQ